MKLNKKGFTLIELLAVIVILLAISVIAISSISAAMERNKAKQNTRRQELIATDVTTYRQEHLNTFNSRFNNAKCISIYELVTNEIISDDESLDADGEMFQGYVVYRDNLEMFEYATECSSS